MKIAISGAGIAGPTLAWWLQRYGHHPVLFEKAPQLRTGGYVIDFWGVGYDVAEKMGLLPALYQKGYLVNSLRMVNRRGATVADFDVARFRPYVDNRFVSIARGDIFYYELTVPEGSNIFDIGSALDSLGVIGSKAFLAAARRTEAIRDLDPRARTLEGYLFPSTYRVTRRTTAEQLCERGEIRFERFGEA